MTHRRGTRAAALSAPPHHSRTTCPRARAEQRAAQLELIAWFSRLTHHVHQGCEVVLLMTALDRLAHQLVEHIWQVAAE